MLWLKALHLIFMVTWFAGLFYLPRLYVYHAMSDDDISNERFKVMERKLFFGIMTPGMIATFIFGIWMLVSYAWSLYSASGWLHAKLALLALMLVYHYFFGESLFLRKIFPGILLGKISKNVRDRLCLRRPRFVLVTSSRPSKGSRHRLQMT